MAILNQAFINGAHAVVRAVDIQARQTASDITSSVITSALSSTASATSTPTSSGTSLPSTTHGPGLDNTDPAQPSTTTGPGNGGGGSGSNTGTSSPLLFFVALGFGVVFTNLWIIVGVKYCFRYNARNRQLRGLDENGEPINLENMPTRPHRRRREKKLMTMDEVNDKFPMMKYKSWVADRAKEGLPTAGGVSAPPSRANSVRSVEGIVPELLSKERESTDASPNTNTTADQFKTETTNLDGTSGSGVENDTKLTQAQTVQTVDTTTTKDLDRTHASDDEEDDEHINAALPPELVATSGDTCAICIDTLEDDDDVRGLTCGHAFHAVCLDPWLTNRRACCPLCKADYYTPKPRPPPPADADPTNPASPHVTDPSRNNGRLNMPRSPQRSFAGWTIRAAPMGPIGGGQVGQATNNDHEARRSPRIWQRRRQDAAPAALAPQQGQQSDGFFGRFRGQFPPFRMTDILRRRRDGSNDPPEPPASGNNIMSTTPSQLEAGPGPSTTTAR